VADVSKVTPLEINANAAGAQANQKALSQIRARVIEVKTDKRLDKAAPGMSQKTPEDPFYALSHKGMTIEPPFDMLTLAMLPEHNSELNQCIEAMEINIDGFGHRYVSRVLLNGETKPPEELVMKVRTERVALENFFSYCTTESFTEFRRKLRKDLEATGNGYFEIIRNAAGRIQAFTHIPSYQMRLGRLDPEPILIDRPILELRIDGSVKASTIKQWTRFRKYAQSKAVHLRNLTTLGGYKIRWFKAFGDPRMYHANTGLEDPTGSLPPEEQANEVIHLTQYSARTPYGLPRYIGNLLSIFGDRAAEEINFVTFRNNNIPSMVVLVSNGQLTEGSIQRIESFVESQIQGSDNYSKFLLLEAETLEESGEDSGMHTKVDIKPLTQDQHRDALFQNYSGNNRDQVRRCFRLPPIFVGRSDDYTRATAESSRRLADEQVFAPERDEFDAVMNRVIFPHMGIIYHKFKSNSPNTTDNQQLVKILAGAEKTGGMTPEIARQMLEDILSAELPGFPDDFPANVPFSLTMAEAVKNKADASEPGQQVTALKALTEDDEGGVFEAECSHCGNTELVQGIEKSDDDLVDHLIQLNRRIEKRWEAAAVAEHEDEPDLGIEE